MSSGTTKQLHDVFGVSRATPLTYVERESVDTKFISSLARGKHITVYGGSKQGKTSLRKHCLEDDDVVVVQGNESSRREIYELVLKEVGATIEVSQSRTSRGESKLSVGFKIGSKIPFLGSASTEGKGEATESDETSTEVHRLDIDPGDVNDVIRLLGAMGFSKFIVLEDFHYLSAEVQKQIAVDLKAFHEKSAISFIVVGVWLESNRLVLYNGDLNGRVIPIDADSWTGEELIAVVDAGQKLLNFSFPNNVRSGLISACQGNVGILQESCFLMCEDSELYHTAAEHVTIGDTEQLDRIVGGIAAEQAGRYNNFIVDVAEGFQKTEHDMYRWIMANVVLASQQELKAGLRLSRLFDRICNTHPNKDRLQMNNVAQALKNLGSLQHKKQIQPIVLDYNSNTSTLRIVDSGFILFVESQANADLLALINMSLAGAED